MKKSENKLRSALTALMGAGVALCLAASAYSAGKPHPAPASRNDTPKQLRERLNADDEAEAYEPLVQAAIRKGVAKEVRAQFPPNMSDMIISGKGVVSLKILPGAGEDKARPTLAKIYSQNGKKGWVASLMTPDTLRPEHLAGPGGTSSYIRAIDEKGRTSILAPCSVSEWPPKKSLLDRGCVKKAGPALEKCAEEAMPVSCMFPLGKEESPIDDRPSRAGDDLDMLESYFGYDDKNLYVVIVVQRAISPGSLTPPTMHHYGVALIDTRKIVPASEHALPQAGVLARYMPLGKDNPGFVAPCALEMDEIPGREKKTDTTGMECQSSGPFLFMKMKRAALGMEKSRELWVMAHTGIISGLEMKDFSYINKSAPTKIYLGGRPGK